MAGSRSGAGVRLWTLLKEESMAGNGMKPRILTCVECGEEFAFTVSAQEYFLEKGSHQSPKRCKACHAKYKREKKLVRT
jgi:hypothetical protein